MAQSRLAATHLARDPWFESGSLQRRVHQTSPASLDLVDTDARLSSREEGV